MNPMPLGDYEAFGKWSGKPRKWGPDGAGWRAWFGGKVIDGLCDVLDEHLAAPRARGRYPAAVGCVPWLTSRAVAQRLHAFSSYCIVVDKPSPNKPLRVPRRLLDPDKAFPNEAIYELRELMPAVDGEPPMTIGPSTPKDATAYEIDPIRIAGCRADQPKPTLHAKLLVLGETEAVDLGPDWLPDYDVVCRFTPQRVWFGSANWTEGSPYHLETGFVCDDPLLAEQATSFVAEMIAFSEPVDSACVGPEPNLMGVPTDWDAIDAVAEEYYRDRPDYEEPDDYEP